MKTNIKMILAMIPIAHLALLMSGCAQVGPAMVDPAVYKTSRDVMTAENRARRNNIELDQARANEWQKVAIAEIQGKATGGGKDQAVTSEGVLGGFPCLFVNDSMRTKTLIIQKYGGFLDGYKWYFTLPGNGGMQKYNLPVGNYACSWTTEYSDTQYPAKPDRFPVTIEPHLHYGKTKESFHGGYRLYGY